MQTRFKFNAGVVLGICTSVLLSWFVGGCAQDTRPTVLLLSGQQEAASSNNKGSTDDVVKEVVKDVFEFHCLDGNVVEPFANPSTRVVVLVFISTDCPIANAYHPTLKQLETKYLTQGVQFFLVNPTVDTTEEQAKSHANEFKLSIPVVLDTDQSIAKMAKAKVTPEATVFTSSGQRPIYRGAIDNLYAGYGKKRAVATKHFLKDALDQSLAGEQVKVKQTDPVGCFISYTEK